MKSQGEMKQMKEGREIKKSDEEEEVMKQGKQMKKDPWKKMKLTNKGNKERTKTWEPTFIKLSICSDLSEFLSDHCCAPRSVTSHTRSVKKLKETHFSRLDTNLDNPS